ncbi:MAG TPA: DNA starvation/stationary phase protection protein Dps [Candidatus Polarisedimenticolaceae bacterium]|nr:DNA starvation/stationary phase protection protein Dps [Candidatus Polarisedimenticolaceae bacterium]
MSVTTSFKTHIDLGAAARDKVIPLLNQQLADTFDLYSQTKQAHWNVKGPSFIALHELFDKLGAELLEHADAIAERATALGGSAFGTVRRAAQATRLQELPADVVSGMAVVEALVARWAALAKSTRQGIDQATEAGDLDTADLFTEVSRALDKGLWFLEAHLQA